MSATPMLDKAATEELTSSEIETALDELTKLNRGGNPRLEISRDAWGKSKAAINFDTFGWDDYAADTVEDVLCKAHKDLLRIIAEEEA